MGSACFRYLDDVEHDPDAIGFGDRVDWHDTVKCGGRVDGHGALGFGDRVDYDDTLRFGDRVDYDDTLRLGDRVCWHDAVRLDSGVEDDVEKEVVEFAASAVDGAGDDGQAAGCGVLQRQCESGLGAVGPEIGCGAIFGVVVRSAGGGVGYVRCDGCDGERGPYRCSRGAVGGRSGAGSGAVGGDGGGVECVG